ncbi:uncharacterized protein LOC144636228 isoform X2 [Oculina patagonica]
MATAEGFLQSPLVVWANNTFKGSALIESITDLADGVFLNEIMMDIDPTYFTLTRIHQNVYGDVNLRMQNLDTLVKHLKRYYQEKLQQLVLLRSPDVVTIAREPQSDEAAEELNKILLLMLGCAVQSDNKEHFIERIKGMDLEVQKSLVEYIQQITDNPDNVLAFRAQDLAEYPVDQLLLFAENMFYHMTQLAEDRDNCVGMMSHLSYERDALLRDSENKNRRAFSPPPSPAVSHNKVMPSEHANKEKIRLLTEEIEEKNVALSELRDELLATKKSLETLRQENKHLSQDARWVKAYRDEIDALKSKTDKVDRLEADNHRFKEKLRDLDYYKKRAEELKEQNELLYETKLVLEEQLTGLNSKEERIEILEEENKKLKTHIHHLAEERQFDQLKLKEIMEENAQLIVDKQNSMAEAAALTSEMDSLRGNKSPGSTTFASEYSESSSIEVLRMQRENQQLRKTIDELKQSGQRIIELEAENEQLQKASLEGKTTVFSLNEELAKLKARGLQQENDLNALRSVVKRQNEELRTSVDNVLNMSGELREKDIEMAQVEEQSLLNFQLSEEKVRDLMGVGEELKEKEAKITQLNHEVEEKQEKITELSRLAEERETNMMELYQRVKENEQEITNLAKQSENKDERITELTKLTQLKEEKLADLNLDVRDKKKEISVLQDLVKDKDDIVAKITQKIKDKDETIAELKESNEAKERRLQSLEKRLSEAAEEQSETEEALKKQRKNNSELENKIEDFLSQNRKSEEHIRRKDDEINDLENRVEETVKQKNRTDENLRKKEKELYELKNGLEKVTDENERLSEELKFKEQKVQSLQKRVEELMLSLDESSETLNKNLKEKEKENRNLERRIEELTESLDEREKIKQVVKEREEKIETLNKSFDEKDKLLQELESRLEESNGERKKLEHVVKLKDKKIEALENSLAEVENTSTVQKDDRLMEMKKNAEGKDNRIIELESRLEDASLANCKLQQSLKIKEEKITELETKIEDIESLSSEKNRLSQSLDHKTKKVLDLETKLEEMSSDNQRLQLSIEQKNGKIRSLENKVLELEESLGSSHLLQQNIKQKDEKVSSLNQVIQEREQKLAELENRLEDAQARNHKLTHNLKIKEEKITTLEESVETLDELVSETKKLNQAVQLKDDKIKALENKLVEFEELSSRNTKLSEYIKQKDNKIVRLQERLDEVEDAVNINDKLNQTVKNKEEKIGSLETRVSELEDQLDNKDKEHREMKLKTDERIKMLEKKLEEYVEEREGKIHDLQSKLEGTVNRYRKLDMTVGEKEMVIAELQAKLIEAQETSREIRKLTQIMKTKDARIENLETKIENVESQFTTQESEIKLKDEKIDTLQKRFDETLNLNNKLDQSVRKKEENIRTLEKTLQANEQREEELEKLLETKTGKVLEYKNRVKELETDVDNKDEKLAELQKRLDNLRSAATADTKLTSALKEKDLKIAEMETRVKELSSTFGQVDKLEKLKKEMEQSILGLETKLEESESQNRRLSHNLKQKETKIDGLEKRVAEMEVSRDDNSQSLSMALKQKDSKIGLLNQNLQQQESENMALEVKLEEVTAQANKFSRLIEQREEQVRGLKTRLEEAVHQNNKMTHAAELKEDKIQTLEKRLEASSKQQQKLTEIVESYDKKAKKDKGQKAKGSSSQTIIFKPADTTRSGQNTVELLAIADRRVAELNEEIRMLEKQSATVTAQNEAMSARNAQLEIENESVKNELQNARADYSALQVDMNDVRDYYHQIDIAASKMGHRCEMLGQLNATLDEENKALVEQVNKLVEQNQDLLVKSLDDKDQFMDGERAFSDRIYALQRQKERLEEQVDLANKALAESAVKPKKKPNFLSRVMRKAGLKKKKDETPKNKRNSVQLLRIDNSPYLEEFETGAIEATPINRRDETASVGSRESSTSEDSRTATKSLLNSSLISAQSEVVLRRQKEGYMSPYISTPVLPRAEEVDGVRLRSATHDMSAFRARQVRSEIFNDSDWSPGRLGRPRSMDSLDKMPSSSSTLTPGDVESGDGLPDKEGAGPSGRHLKHPGMKHLTPSASPSGMRKHHWAKSSPNISPVVSRKEYPVSLEPLPPSPPSPTALQRSSSPHASPILARRLEERAPTRSPHHSPLMGRKDITTYAPSQRDPRRSSLPNQNTQNLDTVPVRERPVEPAKSKVSVQVIASTNTSNNNASPSVSNGTVSSPFLEDQAKRIPVEGAKGSPKGLMFNGGVSNPHHERQRSGSGERRDEPTISTPRGFQRQGSFSGDKNTVKATEPSRNYNTLPSHVKHTRERSSSGDRNFVNTSEPSRSHVQHERERSSGGDTNDGPRIIQISQMKERPSRDTGAVHSRERSLSGDRNEGIRASQRQGTLFVATSGPTRQSVPVTSYYVTSGTVPKSETAPESAASTAGVGTSVYIDATGVDLSSTPAISRGNRAEVSSSSVFAIVRDKRGDEHVLPGLNNTPPSRDMSRANAASDLRSLSSSNIPVSRNTVSADTGTPSRYSAASGPRNGVVSNPVELKPSASERDENRNETVHVATATLQETAKQNVSSVRARILEIEQQPSPEVGGRASSNAQALPDDDDDTLSVSSHHSRDYSPALRKARKARKAAKEKEIFMDSPPSSAAGSTPSGQRSGTDERSRTRSVGSNQGEGKKSSVWYEYGCV